MAQTSVERRALWEASVRKAVGLGYLEPVASVGEALEHGDVGFGYLASSGSLAAIVNGVCYGVGDDGSVSACPESTCLCQVCLGWFDHYAPVFLTGGSGSIDELTHALDARREVERRANCPQVVLAAGTIGRAVLSGVPRRQGGADATGHSDVDVRGETVVELTEVSGKVVGMRMPRYLSVGCPSEWRFVLLGEENDILGCLLGASGMSLACQLTSFDSIELELPADRRFSQIEL